MPQSRIEKMCAGMYFSTGTNDHARRIAYDELVTALKGYLQGTERRYAVTDALTEIKTIFHETGDQAAELINAAIDSEDEQARPRQFSRAVKLLHRHL